MNQPTLSDEQRAMQEQLFTAVQSDDISHVRQLLTQGVDPNWTPDKDDTAGRQPVGVTYLHEAANSDVTDEMFLLLTNWGADPNAIDPDGNTPLLLLCAIPSAVGVRELLDAGANPAISNRDGKNARSLLTQGSEMETHDALNCLELLDEYESRPRINVNNEPEKLKERLFKTNSSQFSPLDNPLVWQQFDVIKEVLTEQGTPLTKEDLKEVNAEGETVLQRAVRYGALGEVLEHLRAQGDRLTVDEIIQKPAFMEQVQEYDAAHSLFTREQLQDEGVEGMMKLKNALGENAMDSVRNQFALKASLHASQQQQTSICR